MGAAGGPSGTLVLEYAAPDEVDRSGRLAAVLAAGGRPGGAVDGIRIRRAGT
ncbi:hypothetical protein [Actinocatenispora thailandica]|uniref:hypothetical protein n=1 Tax=Actinocatenispora thailandica TaxID=227318 RepID=UPI0031D21C7F